MSASSTGTYTNPPDLDPHTWTLMRFTEYENPKGDLEWLIRKDGCMHCEDPGCLKACPAPGAIVQYANGIVDFISENCIGCGYCVKGCPFNIPRISAVDRKSYKCTLCSDRVAVGLEPACVKACPTGAIMFGSKTDMTAWAGERVEELKSRGFETPGSTIRRASAARMSCTCCITPTSRRSMRACRTIRTSACSSTPGRAFLKPLAVAGIVFTAVAGFLHWVVTGSNEVEDKDDEAAAEFIAKRVGGDRNEIPRRNDHPEHARRQGQPLDHRDLLRAVGGVRLVDVPSDAVLALGSCSAAASGRARSIPGSASCLSLSYAGLIVQFWRDNFWNRDDIAWLNSIFQVIENDEENIPEVGRFNAGQKFVFWSMALLVPALLLTGLVIWEAYFGDATPIETQRAAALIHSLVRRGGDHDLDHPRLRGDLGARIGARDDPRLRDARLGLAPSPQMVPPAGDDRLAGPEAEAEAMRPIS